MLLEGVAGNGSYVGNSVRTVYMELGISIALEVRLSRPFLDEQRLMDIND